MASKLTEQIKELPDAPGVYFFKRGKQVLYIGKATSLKSRVRSYFAKDLAEKRSPWIAQMITQADRIDFLETDSVLEALILESREIKKHQPPYNAREKDDKSYLYVVITDEEYPRVLTIRGKDLALNSKPYSLKTTFGPFPHGGELREALKIIRKIFPFRDKCVPNSGRPCFDAQIGLCPGVCEGRVGKAEYRRLIRHLVLFFEGKKGALLKQLEKEMKAAAKAEEFEKASELKKKIFALGHIRDVALIKKPQGPASGFRLEAYDIAHLSGQHSVGVMVAMIDGEFDKNSYRRFKLRLSREASAKWEGANDIASLMQVLERRLNHPEWLLPNLIVVDGGKAQINLASGILRERGLAIPVVGVVKDERHKARELLGSAALVQSHREEIVRLNAEAHRFAIGYHRRLRDRLSGL